ncbi:MAG TPA: NAD(P)H-hydrate dehydratase [Gammaproteobacteria bacterium]|nr:NAD(P)H-hydrate dehydratase [Gammaproteobacteria bacterium]
MERLPHTLYRAAEVRALDRIAIEDCGIPGAELMARAGRAAFTHLRALWPEARRLAVLCGGGNNGGDGFVLARCAHEAGLAVEVRLLGESARLKGDALEAWQAMEAAGFSARPYGGESLDGFDAIVDALLGTGLDRPVEGRWRAAIEAVNAAGAPVLALDIPSGLDADRGTVLGTAVRAQATVTFIGLKQGLFTAEGPDCSGRLFYEDLDVPPEIFRRFPPSARRITLETEIGLLAPRPRASHKGHYGHVLVVGGAPGMSGAARLAGEAAARCGAGLVTLATAPDHAAFLNLGRPELMVRGVADARDLRRLLAQATVVAVGPGLGLSPWARGLLDAVLESPLPVVVDADALNLLAGEPARREDWILTPHPGEAARLLGEAGAAAVQADRFLAARRMQERYGGIVVLKGNGTLVCEAGQAPALCDAGNPGMAAGGMGDVLTGVIAACLAQGLAPGDAARLGVCLHAHAGDRAAASGQRGLMAGDLMPWLQRLAG